MDRYIALQSQAVALIIASAFLFSEWHYVCATALLIVAVTIAEKAEKK